MVIAYVFVWGLAAREAGMAPSMVVAEHLIKRIIYAQAYSVDALVSAGVRIQGVQDLATLLRDFDAQHEATSVAQSAGGNRKHPLDPVRCLDLPKGTFTSAKRWQHAVYKPGRGGVLAAWESSYNRFIGGEHPAAIAMNQPSGKPVQVSPHTHTSRKHTFLTSTA